MGLMLERLHTSKPYVQVCIHLSTFAINVYSKYTYLYIGLDGPPASVTCG